MRDYKALALLKDKNGTTVGVRMQSLEDDHIRNFNKDYLLAIKHNLNIVNVVITSNGVIRSKIGYGKLKKVLYTALDSYAEDIIEETGLLFEKSQKQGYDFEDFVNKYMNSYLRENIDARHAYYATMMNYDMLDFILNKEKLKVKHNDNPFDYILANWIGEFYSYIQV